MRVMQESLAISSAVRALLTALSDRRLTFFAGAGVSSLAPTRLPMAEPIKRSLVGSLAERLMDTPEREWASAMTDDRLASLPFELVLDATYNVLHSHALRIFEVCAVDEPN